MSNFVFKMPFARSFISSSLLGLGLYSLCAALTLPSAFAEKNEIQFWHWWNSASEVKNIDVLNRHLNKHGLVWTNTAANHSSSSLYLAQISTQLKEQLPDAAMLDNSEVHNYDHAFSLVHLNPVAQAQDWEEVIPLAIQDQAKHQGHWVSAPLNSHSSNWLWINKELFMRLKLPIPETWQDLITVLERAQALGIPALATPRDNWEKTLLFELVVLSTGGLEFYRNVFVEQQSSPADKQILAEALLRFKQLSNYFSANTNNLSWDQATAQLAQGKVLMQVHGSWVISELTVLGAEAEHDYLCVRFPGTQAAYIFHSDHVVFFKSAQNQINNQLKLARLLLDKDFQRELSITSGAAPARVDIDIQGFNHCSQKNIQELRMANMRRAVMPSINRNNLEQIVGDYLAQRINTSTAATQVLQLARSPSTYNATSSP